LKKFEKDICGHEKKQKKEFSANLSGNALQNQRISPKIKKNG